MTATREPGELTGKLDRQLHQWLLGRSALYAYAVEENKIGLMIRLQRDYLDEFITHIETCHGSG